MTVSISFIYTGVNCNTQPSTLHENYGRQSIYKQFLPALPCPALPPHPTLPVPPHTHSMGLGLQVGREHHNHMGLT